LSLFARARGRDVWLAVFSNEAPFDLFAGPFYDAISGTGLTGEPQYNTTIESIQKWLEENGLTLDPASK
jgi:hypothetical protein